MVLDQVGLEVGICMIVSYLIFITYFGYKYYGGGAGVIIGRWVTDKLYSNYHWACINSLIGDIYNRNRRNKKRENKTTINSILPSTY